MTEKYPLAVIVYFLSDPLYLSNHILQNITTKQLLDVNCQVTSSIPAYGSQSHNLRDTSELFSIIQQH